MTNFGLGQGFYVATECFDVTIKLGQCHLVFMLQQGVFVSRQSLARPSVFLS